MKRAERTPLLDLRVPSLMAIMAALAALAALGTIGCSEGPHEIPDGGRHAGDLELEVGDLVVGRDCRVDGDVVLHAGNLTVGSRSVIRGAVRVVQGNIGIAAEARLDSLRVATGTIRVGRAAEVAGTITLGRGLCELDGAVVGGRVQLFRGRLEVRGGSVLHDGIRVRDPGEAPRDSTYVVLQAGCRVEGEVALSGRVRLVVDPGAATDGAVFTDIRPE